MIFSMWLDFISLFPDPLGPLLGGPGRVKMGIWYRFSELYGISTALCLEHLVRKEKHGQVGLYANLLEEDVTVVELFGVLADKMNRDNVSLCLHALGNERLGPGYILYYSVYLA